MAENPFPPPKTPRSQIIDGANNLTDVVKDLRSVGLPNPLIDLQSVNQTLPLNLQLTPEAFQTPPVTEASIPPTQKREEIKDDESAPSPALQLMQQRAREVGLDISNMSMGPPRSDNLTTPTPENIVVAMQGHDPSADQILGTK